MHPAAWIFQPRVKNSLMTPWRQWWFSPNWVWTQFSSFGKLRALFSTSNSRHCCHNSFVVRVCLTPPFFRNLAWSILEKNHVLTWGKRHVIFFNVSYGLQLLEICNIYMFEIILNWLFNGVCCMCSSVLGTVMWLFHKHWYPIYPLVQSAQ